MSTSTAPPKEKVSVYIDPALSRLLRIEKAETRRSVTDIVEDLVRSHFAKESKRANRVSA